MNHGCSSCLHKYWNYFFNYWSKCLVIVFSLLLGESSRHTSVFYTSATCLICIDQSWKSILTSLLVSRKNPYPSLSNWLPSSLLKQGNLPGDFISPSSFWSYDLVFPWHLSPSPGSCLFIWSFLRSGLLLNSSESTRTSSSLMGYTWCWIPSLNMKSWVKLQVNSTSCQGGFIILWTSLLWVLVLMFGHLWSLLLLTINLHIRYSGSQK